MPPKYMINKNQRKESQTLSWHLTFSFRESFLFSSQRAISNTGYMICKLIVIMKYKCFRKVRALKCNLSYVTLQFSEHTDKIITWHIVWYNRKTNWNKLIFRPKIPVQLGNLSCGIHFPLAPQTCHWRWLDWISKLYWGPQKTKQNCP